MAIKKTFIIVIFIFLFHFLSSIYIINNDNVPFYFDEGGFYNLSVSYYKYLFATSDPAVMYRHFHSISNFYPPLLFILSMPLYAFLGISQDTFILVNLFFLFVLLCTVYLTGKYLKNEKTGLLAAFIVSFYPAIYGFTRSNFMTIPVAATVAASFYFLLRSEYFTRRKWSVFFGLSAGFALLIKWIFIVYIAPGVLFFIIAAIRKRKEIKISRVFVNVLLALTICILLALSWYLPNIKNLPLMIANANYDNPNWCSAAKSFLLNPFNLNLLKYLVIIERYQMHTLFVLLFLWSFARWLLKKPCNNDQWAVVCSVVIPYLIFSLFVIDYYSPELCPRYIIPLFGFFAVITASSVLDIRNRLYRNILVSVIIVIGLAQFYLLCFGNKSNSGLFTREDFVNRNTRGLLLSKQVSWPVYQIRNSIREVHLTKKPGLLIIPHTPVTSAFTYLSEISGDIDLYFPLNAEFTSDDYVVAPAEDYNKLLDIVDFVLVQKGGKLSYNDAKWIEPALAFFNREFEKRKDEFTLFKEFDATIDEIGVTFQLFKKNKTEFYAHNDGEPEGQGAFIYPQDFNRGNLIYSGEYNLLIDGGYRPSFIAFDDIYLDKGEYAVWVLYATYAIRPVDIYIDGVLKKKNALITPTNGYNHTDAKWVKVFNARLSGGRHSLKLIRDRDFPHIGAIKFIRLNDEKIVS